MKKQALLLMAGGVLAFASCNTTTNEGAYQAQIDSMVNARVEEIRLEMMAQNDSMINELALIKADSIIAAMKGVPVSKRPSASKPRTSNGGSDVNIGSNAAKPVGGNNTVDKGGLKSQSDNNRNNSTGTVQGGGLKSQSDNNRTNNATRTEGGGLKSQSDQERTR